MALHQDAISLIKESLPELLVTAERCITYEKPEGGCLGYPAALSLFAIADTIGSFHRGDFSFKVRIDGREKAIKKEVRHFYIFNSDYYGQDLSDEQIGKLYNNCRSLLVHNAALAFNHFLMIGAPSENFSEMRTYNGTRCYVVSLVPFLEITKKAVTKFLPEIDKLSGSKTLKGIEEKR